MPTTTRSLDSEEVFNLIRITLSVLFLSSSGIRFCHLRYLSSKVVSSRFEWIKYGGVALNANICLFNLITISISYRTETLVVLDASVAFAAATCLCVLTPLEHRRTVRPSSLIILYLIGLTIVDSVLVSLVSVHTKGFSAWSLKFLQLFSEVLLLFFELHGKSLVLKEPWDKVSSEEAAGVFSRAFFWWINPVLALGYTKNLISHELSSIDQSLDSRPLRQQVVRTWDQRTKPEDSRTLPVVLLKILSRPFVSVIIPRLALIIFRYAQPVLISQTIRFCSGDAELQHSAETGFWIIVAAVVIYTGLAITTAAYRHGLNRLRVMTRGALVSLVHSKSLVTRENSLEDGKAISLFSTDVDGLETSGEMFHETWAQFVEVVIGMTMLGRTVGWLWTVPLIIILFCSRMSRYVAKHLKTRQKDWNIATQDRISMTSEMLSSIKSIKMTGITEAFRDQIQDLRLKELGKASKVRWLMVAYNASGIFSPVITIVVYAIMATLNGSRLDAETGFTSIAILALVTHPANMIMTIVPQAIASFASFERIQNYLLQPARQDSRLEIYRSPPDRTLRDISAKSRAASKSAIEIKDMTVRSPTRLVPSLQHINLDIKQGDIVICSGATGSGKTILVKTMLGEVAATEGKISVSFKKVGLCSQTSWLPNLSIKDIICGPNFVPSVDLSWYTEVVKTCCLEDDFRFLPRGDEYLAGNRGLNLSGGQRQRVALARAIFARNEMVILDDTFSALDGNVENKIINNLFGPSGIFKALRTTVFWITNTTQHFRLAKDIIVLKDGQIIERGGWETLQSNLAQIAKLVFVENGSSGGHLREPVTDNKLSNQNQLATDAAADLSRRTGDLQLYGYYFKVIGVMNVVLLVIFTASNGFFINFPQYWLKRWTETDRGSNMFYGLGFVLLYTLAWVSTNGSMWSTVIRIAPQSGLKLHQRLLKTVTEAALAFFSATDMSRILNRFGQDIQLIDKQLPPALLSLSVQVFKLIVQIALLYNTQKFLILSLPLCALIIYVVQRIYLRTSRQLRLLELESRSGVYSSFLETVEGIVTIRAFGWQASAEAENIQQLDESQKPFYLLFCLQRWLNLVLDLFVAGIAVLVISFAVKFKGTTTGGQVGVALNVVIVANTTLLRLVESWTTLEICLGAIARLKTLEKEVPSEDLGREDVGAPDGWSCAGQIDLRNVTAAYSAGNAVLLDVNLRITAGQKVVICGRTGCGKSTLLQVLLGMLDLQSGSIHIDGLDTSLISKGWLRRHCFVTVPQDPLLLYQGSLRFNLDPYETSNDEVLISALQRTGLWLHLSTTERRYQDNADDDFHSRNVLNSPLSNLPILSAGQAQLLALSRALVQVQGQISSPAPGMNAPVLVSHHKPIIILDEATSSLDSITESLIHEIVDEEFSRKGHTVIIVAHRLNAFERERDSGSIAVLMSKGQIERVGSMQDMVRLSAQSLEDSASQERPNVH